MKPLVLVAGPVTRDPIGGLRRAVGAAKLLTSLDMLPILPQLQMFHEMIDPQPYRSWIDLNLGILEHCQGMIRVLGESAGADGEVARCAELEIPVLVMPDHGPTPTDEDLARWVRDLDSWTEAVRGRTP